MTEPDTAQQIVTRIAGELNAQTWQVKAAVALLDEGATVPFVARYRKEMTGSLDDAQLRDLTERLDYLRDLQDRKKTVLESIAAQGKLTDGLAAASPVPRRSRGSRTSTCRTSPSGAPRRRSPGKPDWNPSPTGCSGTRRSIRTPPPPRSSTSRRAWPTPTPRSPAPGRS